MFDASDLASDMKQAKLLQDGCSELPTPGQYHEDEWSLMPHLEICLTETLKDRVSAALNKSNLRPFKTILN